MLEVAAILTLVGIILVVPVLTWGVYRFVLNTIDGDPQFNDLFAGFSDYGLNLGRMLALMIIYGALAQIPQLFTPAVNDTAGTVLIGLALNLIAFLVSMRLVFAFFFVVDWREGPIQALKSSWAATGGQWLSVLAFNVVGVGVLLLGTLLFIVGFIPALMIFMASSAAVYRQMVLQARPRGELSLGNRVTLDEKTRRGRVSAHACPSQEGARGVSRWGREPSAPRTS